MVDLPLWKNDGVEVSWDDDIPNWMEKVNKNVPKDQPDPKYAQYFDISSNIFRAFANGIAAVNPQGGVTWSDRLQ